ncbi:hypothetical protein Leryth_026717 [Lithospermum erythrorhizon]|nr:hypothetical protein Leryth_026717 [Lithospermum erythrorhizon]
MASTSKDWANLPDLVFHMIFMKLFHHSVAIDSVQVGAVCKSWRAVILVSPLAITYQNNEKDAGSSYMAGWLFQPEGEKGTSITRHLRVPGTDMIFHRGLLYIVSFDSKIATVDIERKFENKNRYKAKFPNTLRARGQ